MKKQIISTESAPAAIGPYSQAVKTGDVVYLSGQIPLDPTTMTVVEGGLEAQAKQVLINLDAVANAAGGSLKDAVKLTVYMVDLSGFDVLNKLMADYLSEPYPARATIQVGALPKGVLVEIDAVLSLS